MSKRLLLGLLLTTGIFYTQAQSPCSWRFSVIRISEQVLEIHCAVRLNASWHIYSQNTPEGGPFPTVFSFIKNPLFTLQGKVLERGKMLKLHENVFDVDIKYFEDQVDFIQKIIVKGKNKTNLIGSVEFMVCNSEKCLPPALQNFNISLN